MHYIYLTLLVLYPIAIHGYSIHTNLKENAPSISDKSRSDTENGSPIIQGILKFFQDKKQDDVKDKKSAQNRAIVLKNTPEKNLIAARDMASKLIETRSNNQNIGRHYFHMDPVFNSLNTRRARQKRIISSSSSSDTEVEGPEWKAEWNEKRLIQKFHAVNSTQPRGDVVNMKAARPWGFQCGDPNQYDHPWGTCMLPEECDAEYRIYLGDSFCGRNQFVCCAIERSAYDMYQGLDMSFQREDSWSTDTEDEQPHDSHIERHKQRKRAKRKNKRVRSQLKKKIRTSIKNIITEITKLLQKAYRNGTNHRMTKTRELKSFIKKMKKQYREDRMTVVDAHDFNMANYEIKWSESLAKIRGMNEAFLSNDTFRDIVVNGTVNKENLLKLQRTHPVLSLFFNNRRMGGGDLEPEPEKIKLEKKEEVPESVNIKPETEGEVSEPERKNPKLRGYDIEYGMLYY